MQDLIKRYFWVLGGVAVMICAYFAALAANHVVEAKYLNDSDHAPKITPAVPTSVATATTKPTRSKDGAQFAARDMFCSDCTPPVEVASSGDPSSIQATTLPLSLLATNVGLVDEDSYATIVNTENQKQGAYAIGDPVPGATGKLIEIHYKYVDFENGGHVERLALLGAAPPPVVAAATPGAGSGDDMQAMIDNGIKKIDDNHYEISKDLVDKVLLNPMGFVKGARVVPAMANGKPNGFKLYSIRPASVYSKLGLENGDTMQAINGLELTSAEKALEVYTKLRDATNLEVSLTRRGKPDTITYSIR